MAGTTPNLALYLPGGGSTGVYTPDEVADVDPLNQNFVKIDQFAGTVGVQTSRNQQFYGPAAAIASVVGMKLGDEYQESDGSKFLWRYDGSNWVLNQGGLQLIRPTSVNGTNVTISADGGVNLASFPAGQSARVNGVFSGRFRWYRIKFSYGSTFDGGWQFRLATGGVDDTSNNYRYNFGTTGAANGNPVTSSVGVSTVCPLAAQLAVRGLMEFDLDAPALATTTVFDFSHSLTTVAAVVGRSTGMCLLNTNGVYDGFSLISSTANFDGNIKVYGYV